STCRSSTRWSTFFFHHRPTTAIYTLSLHDALPIFRIDDRVRAPGRYEGLVEQGRDVGRQRAVGGPRRGVGEHDLARAALEQPRQDRKSTRLNSSHVAISYAVFCLKKKKRRGIGSGR